MPASDVDYYKRRLFEERDMARKAKDARSRAIHDDLASLYQKMIDSLEGPSTKAA